MPGEDLAISSRIFTRKACHRICKAGFEHAKQFGYKSVTVCEKPNVIRETSGMMMQEAKKFAKEYAGIVGGLGFACSANIGKDVAVFEPTHGTAPKYGKLD